MGENMKKLTVCAAAVVCLELVAFGASEWSGIAQVDGTNLSKDSLANLTIKSSSTADSAEFAPCGHVGQGYICSP